MRRAHRGRRVLTGAEQLPAVRARQRSSKRRRIASKGSSPLSTGRSLLFSSVFATSGRETSNDTGSWRTIGKSSIHRSQAKRLCKVTRRGMRIVSCLLLCYRANPIQTYDTRPCARSKLCTFFLFQMGRRCEGAHVRRIARWCPSHR